MAMMSHVFTESAMRECATRGHHFSVVRAWHDIGWRECLRCGESSAIGPIDSEASQPTVAQCTPDRDLQIVALRAAGKTTVEIGRLVGVSQSRVSQIIQRIKAKEACCG